MLFKAYSLGLILDWTAARAVGIAVKIISIKLDQPWGDVNEIAGTVLVKFELLRA